jgi:hypothetical protein
MTGYSSVSVNGQVEGKKQTEEWFAKVVEFRLAKGDKEKPDDEVTLSNPAHASLVVTWLHKATDVLQRLPKIPNQPEYEMLRQAIHKGHYVIGVKPQSQPILLDTIMGQWSKMPARFNGAPLIWTSRRHCQLPRYIHLLSKALPL